MKSSDVPVEFRRGDLVWLNCDPSVGAEPRKIRTCVVVSNDVANEFGSTLTVVPTQQFTKERAERGYMVDLRKPRSTMKAPRVANCSMIMTYDRSRIVGKEGRVMRDTLDRINRALLLHLGIG